MIRELKNPRELDAAFAVLKELRPELTPRAFRQVYRKARATDGYTLVGLFKGETCVAVMGYRVLHDILHRKHLYVDDLVTSAAHRSQGHGARLLKHAEGKAGALGCRLLRLCTGAANEAAIKFYKREGWEQRSVVFKKTVNGTRLHP